MGEKLATGEDDSNSEIAISKDFQHLSTVLKLNCPFFQDFLPPNDHGPRP